MTPRTWIEMGDELRGELAGKQDEAAFLVLRMLGEQVHALGDEMFIEAPLWLRTWLGSITATRDVQRIYTANEMTDRVPRRDVRRRFGKLLRELRGHGRCLDWPDEPWKGGGA